MPESTRVGNQAIMPVSSPMACDYDWAQDMKNLVRLGAVQCFLGEIGHPNPQLLSDEKKFVSALEKLCRSQGFKLVGGDSNPNDVGGYSGVVPNSIPVHLDKEIPTTLPPSALPVADDDYLEKKNSHPRDADLHFDEAKHVYTIGGNKFAKSVTGFCDSSDFNPNFIIPRIIKSDRWSNDPDYEYYQMSRDDILKHWDFGRDLGTELHRDIEIFLNRKTKLEDEFLTRKLSTAILKKETLDNIQDMQQASSSGYAATVNATPVVAPQPSMFDRLMTPFTGSGKPPGYENEDDKLEFPSRADGNSGADQAIPRPISTPPSLVERKYFLAFMKDILETRKWKPFRTEWRIFDKELGIAGTIDFVAMCDKDLKTVSYDFGDVPEPKNELPVLEDDPVVEPSSTGVVTSNPTVTAEDSGSAVEDSVSKETISVEDSTAAEPEEAEGGSKPKRASKKKDGVTPKKRAIKAAIPPPPEPKSGTSKQLILIDWKRSKQCKKSAYQKQLNLYRYLLMKNYKDPTLRDDDGNEIEFFVKELYIVRLHPISNTYDLVNVPIDEDLAINALKKHGLNV